MSGGSEFLALSLVPLLCAACAGLVCALPGHFLVLRQQSMLADAVSHVALPGIVGAFILSGGLGTLSALLGAACSALLALGLIELIRRFGRVEPGAATGVVFTTLFAGGVLLLEASQASAFHLDVEHALYGNLESLIWLDARDWGALLDPAALATLPDALPRLGGALVLVLAFIIVAWRALVMGSFDPAYARSIGARPQWTQVALMIVTAVAAVAAFEAMGAIIVVALFIVPAASARLLCPQLKTQVMLSARCVVGSSMGGYLLAAHGPLWLGLEHSLSAAGMIAVVNGALLLCAALVARRRRARIQA